MADQDYILTEEYADDYIAGLIANAATATRKALTTVMPTGGGPTGAVPAAIVTSVVQAADGSWPNPVRVGDGARLFSGQPGRPYPRYSDGLRAGDFYVSVGVFRRCLTSDGVTPTSWAELLLSAGTPGQVVTTDPGATAPVPEDTPSPTQPTPQMTVRPSVLLRTVGVWSSTGSTSLIEALSDQHVTGVTATPSTQGGGVAIQVGVTPLKMSSGNDLLVTLWGLRGTSDGTVTVQVTRNGAQIAAPVTVPVTTTVAAGVEARWKAADLPILTSWDGLAVEVVRGNGGIDLADLTVQSVPPVTVPQPEGGGNASSSSIFGGIFGSDLRAAPRSIYTDAKRGYLTSAGQIILGCYDDAPMVVTATNTTPRVKVTTTVSGGNKTDGSGWADSVPIPASTKSPSNRWKVLVVVSPQTDEVWEFVDAAKSSAGAWSCTRGGKIAKASTSKGVMPTGTGITGSGLALAAARITLEEARRAKNGDPAAISHTLGLNLPGNFYGANYWTAPATRTDGTLSAATEEVARKTTPLTGDRVRLRKDFDATSLTGLPRAIAETLKTFGAVVYGGSAKPSLICESGETEQGASGIEPWGDLLGGKSVDQMLSWLKAADLEFVPAGWLSSTSTVNETPLSSGGGVATPTNPGTTPTDPGNTSGMRRQIKMPAGVKWMSGASCRAIEDSSEGMNSPFASWRGEPCYMARTWWDQPGNDATTTLYVRWKNWHASIDCGPGYFYKGETMAQAASGAFVDRWTKQLQQTRQWWQTRRDPSVVTVFYSPAHEMNGSWYPWSVTKDNYKQFIDSWKRIRELQLKHFPEALLTFNANRDTSGSNHRDWRDYVPGWSYGGGKISDWVDCGGIDYYNFWPAVKTQADWDKVSVENDGFGAPKGIEQHRRFWEAQGLPMEIPEWGCASSWGDNPYFADAMNQYMRKWAGTGAGRIPGDAYFNLSTGYDTDKFAIYGDTVGSPNFAARYKALTWGN